MKTFRTAKKRSLSMQTEKMLRCPRCNSDGVFKKFDSTKGNLYECWICEQRFFITEENFMVMIPSLYTPKEVVIN